jgi:hypothetical protein
MLLFALAMEAVSIYCSIVKHVPDYTAQHRRRQSSFDFSLVLIIASGQIWDGILKQSKMISLRFIFRLLYADILAFNINTVLRETRWTHAVRRQFGLELCCNKCNNPVGLCGLKLTDSDS